MYQKYIQLFLVAFIFVAANFVFGEEKNEDLIFSLVNKGQRLPEVLWPLGIVPYYLDHRSYDSLISRRVRMVMNSLEDLSCITFKAILEPNYDGGAWVHITNPEKVRDCVHTDFNNNSSMEINLVLGYECLQSRNILHSLMHALGFKDEVTHPQRDQYVRIMWENIQPKYQPLFGIRYDDFSPVITEYDPMSIMHFHDRAFSKNGQATIAPLIPGLMINPSDELSPLDKMRLRLVFGHECNKRKVGDLLDSCKSAMHSSQSIKLGTDAIQPEDKNEKEGTKYNNVQNDKDDTQGNDNDDSKDDNADNVAKDGSQDLDNDVKDNPQGTDDDGANDEDGNDNNGSKEPQDNDNGGTKDDDPQDIDNGKNDDSGNNNNNDAKSYEHFRKQ